MREKLNYMNFFEFLSLNLPKTDIRINFFLNPAFLTFQDSSKNPSLGAQYHMGRARVGFRGRAEKNGWHKGKSFCRP